MHSRHNRFIRAPAHSTLFAGVGCAAIALFLSSCSADLSVQRETQQAEGFEHTAPYSIVCVIHGDGEYLYHDTSGIEYRADEQAVRAAQRVAQQNPDAEVFIFHQRPRRHFLFFFPLRDGEFYYYRNGRLIAHELYWRNQEEATVSPVPRRRSARSGKPVPVLRSRHPRIWRRRLRCIVPGPGVHRP